MDGRRYLAAMTYAPPAPPRPARPGWLIPVVVGLVALVVLLAAAVVWFALGSKPAGSAAAAPTSAAPAQVAKPQQTQAERTYYTPTKLDFTVTVKITEKKCFGSAGCNVTYHIDMKYGGDTLDPSKTYKVTYEVSGVDDGPAINTFEVTGDQWSYDEEEFGQTPNSSTKLKARVTDIEES